jgi:hypothetical protein
LSTPVVAEHLSAAVAVHDSNCHPAIPHRAPLGAPEMRRGIAQRAPRRLLRRLSVVRSLIRNTAAIGGFDRLLPRTS